MRLHALNQTAVVVALSVKWRSSLLLLQIAKQTRNLEATLTKVPFTGPRFIQVGGNRSCLNRKCYFAIRLISWFLAMKEGTSAIRRRDAAAL